MVKRNSATDNLRSCKKKKTVVVHYTDESTDSKHNVEIFPVAIHSEAGVPETDEGETAGVAAGPEEDPDDEADVNVAAPAVEAPIVHPLIVCSIKTPVKGRWRGLRAKKAEKAKSNRSKCGGCDETIEKGTKRIQVTDYSFYAALKGKGQVDRPYLEINIPGYGNSVAARSFWIHEECHVAADEKCKAKFDADWANVRALILSGALVI